MEPNRYVLKGSSLAKLGVRALAEYGPQARIVSAERVRRGGIGGFMAREHFEATVEVPAPRSVPSPPPPLPTASEAGSRRRRRLLEEARAAAETPAPSGSAPAGPPDPGSGSAQAGSARSGSAQPEETLDEDFARLMDELWNASRDSAAPARLTSAEGSGRAETGAETRAETRADVRAGARAGASRGSGRGEPPAAPQLLRAPGALIVLACLGVDGSGARTALLERSGGAGLGDPLPLKEGLLAGRPLREAKQVLRESRARAVSMNVPVLAGCTVRFPRPGVSVGAESPMITEADQLWAVVDLRRKPEDLRYWLSALDTVRPIDGLVLTCAEETLSPEAGDQLGWPVSVRMNQC